MSTSRLRPLRILLVSTAVAACSLVAGVGAGCKSNSIASTTNSSGSAVIGPNGGIVALDDGTEVRIPAGALTKDTMITLSVAAVGNYPPLNFAALSKVYAFEPHGLKFNTPVIIDLPFAIGGASQASLVAIHAEPNGAWGPVNATIGMATAEISTGSFSFYAVASTSQSEAGGPTCSGRSPDNGAPSGTVSNMSGMIAANPPYPAVDLSTLKNGYALNPGSQPGVQLTFTLDQATACGGYRNSVYKIGAYHAEILVLGSNITTMTYAGATFTTTVNGIAPSQTPGSCGQMSNAASPPLNTGTGVTITAIDTVHVAGSFDYTPPGGTPLKGTFDLPFCKVNPGLDPPSCCVP